MDVNGGKYAEELLMLYLHKFLLYVLKELIMIKKYLNVLKIYNFVNNILMMVVVLNVNMDSFTEMEFA